jgi:hypothetical protein
MLVWLVRVVPLTFHIEHVKPLTHSKRDVYLLRSSSNARDYQPFRISHPDDPEVLMVRPTVQ